MIIEWMENKFCEKVLEESRKRGIMPDIPSADVVPIPAIHKVEWDLTFHCNDYCSHCVTDSGPKCEKFTDISDGFKIIENIHKYSLLNRIKNFYNDEVEFEFSSSSILKKLENMKKPPLHLNDKLASSYVECLHGKNYKTILKTKKGKKILNFGRPHIRLSGGEFFTWPNKKSVDENLEEQKILLKKLREKLPDYDIWILTNGRFAESVEKTDKVLYYWSENLKIEDEKTGKTRICISTDPFHSPPKDSNIDLMLERIWKSCMDHGFSAPFLYGIPSREIYYAGRAFDNFNLGYIKDLEGFSNSDFNPQKKYVVTTKNIIESDGCVELKGFIVELDANALIPVNNVNVNPEGHLTFCCAQVGDYGDFVSNPEFSLKNIICDPISFMMRRAETAIPFLNLASEMDPSIEILEKGKNSAAISSTCYQMLSGKRKI